MQKRHANQTQPTNHNDPKPTILHHVTSTVFESSSAKAELSPTRESKKGPLVYLEVLQFVLDELQPEFQVPDCQSQLELLHVLEAQEGGAVWLRRSIPRAVFIKPPLLPLSVCSLAVRLVGRPILHFSDKAVVHGLS